MRVDRPESEVLFHGLPRSPSDGQFPPSLPGILFLQSLFPPHRVGDRLFSRDQPFPPWFSRPTLARPFPPVVSDIFSKSPVFFFALVFFFLRDVVFFPCSIVTTIPFYSSKGHGNPLPFPTHTIIATPPVSSVAGPFPSVISFLVPSARLPPGTIAVFFSPPSPMFAFGFFLTFRRGCVPENRGSFPRKWDCFF